VWSIIDDAKKAKSTSFFFVGCNLSLDDDPNPTSLNLSTLQIYLVERIHNTTLKKILMPFFAFQYILWRQVEEKKFIHFQKFVKLTTFMMQK